MKKPLKIFRIHFVKTILTVLCLIHFLGEKVIAQTTINAPDTIPSILLNTECQISFSQRMIDVIITTRDKYEELDFTLTDEFDGRCPLPEIDFDKNILVMHKYKGSNCHQGIHAVMLRKGNEYNVKFSTYPNSVCRDLQTRCIVFIIPKPVGEFDFYFEQVAEKVK